MEKRHLISNHSRSPCLQSLVLSKVDGSFGLKCSILSKLAACCRHTKGGKQLKASCETGLAICQKGATSPEG